MNHCILSLIGCVLAIQQSQALIMTGKGNRPVNDYGWPKGALEVANLPARIGWAEGPPFGGGQWTFYYRGDTNALQSALEKFAEIKAPVLEVVLHEGKGVSPFTDGSFDWSFEVWVPKNWDLLYNNPQSVFNSRSQIFANRSLHRVWISG